MDGDEVWQAIDRERAGLADFLDDLSEREWETPSLCDGWRVREVAAHLTLAHTGPGRALLDLVRARGSFDRMIRDTAVRQARLPVDGYSGLLRAMIGSRRTAPFVTPMEPLLDALVHGQDMAIPLGRERPMPVRAAAACADRVWTMGWPFRARRRLRGFQLAATDCSWSAGEGQRVEGPVSAILLLLTGRTAAVAQLSGPGAADLRRHVGLAVGQA
ncbi:maleylpyruvate isomerase family mycothiol-dependent enzyme [Thermoactinospora rubra]|uniref:maleylpyruvate isomerase family mycothiol-dependent enzyme n=1 Tax=Thermoactinospora rubra TaxID=1088767 RepID=UPI000A111DE9|nr:maleylpyruvate isomerase family mycothiol-dependent enzyme [Thermoactinospora rubra]